MVDACPVCRSSTHREVLSLPGLPVLINAQVRPDEALDVPRGDIDLVVCTGCGHLFNRSFDDQLLDYDATYENTLHFSEHFRSFAHSLASQLVSNHRLGGEVVAEFGSGPGHFLSMLCDEGVSQAYGWDPSYDPERLGAPTSPSVTISTDRFPDDGSFPVALALSQHVLEHLGEPVAALTAQRLAVTAKQGVVYSEVPNGQLMIQQCALWDLIYEHLSYFVPTSLDLACRLAGLDVTSMGAAFGDQFLWCEAEPSNPIQLEPRPDAAAVERAIAEAEEFGRAAVRRIEQARRDLARWAADGPVALWGAGSKGMTYLNVVADVAPIAAVVDLNPRKSGAGVPGTSLVISGPDSLVDNPPRTVLVSNPVYRDEIAQNLASLGVDAELELLWA
ncbi:MAG: methyltransferase domain-containing protein [Ilumatobacteraceae bacterium]